MIAQYLLARGDQPKPSRLSAAIPSVATSTTRSFAPPSKGKASEARDIPDFIALLESSKDDWSKEVIETLASATVENYRQAFKSREGDEHRRLVFNALQFSNLGNATAATRQITEKATAALQAIAEESPFNAFRVARFGVSAKPAAQVDKDGQEVAL